MIRTALYVRVSTQEQAKEGYSIGEQTGRLTKYADAHGWYIVKTYTDAGFSGSTMDRPALQDMLSDVKSGRIDKVVVYKLDRLSRSQKDTLNIIEDVLLAHSCDFESMSEKFDTATPFGKAMLGILAVFAQLEREQIKERMALGIEARMKEGKWRSGCTTPFGYDYDAENGRLVINDYEAMIVKKVFESFLQGKSIYRIYSDFETIGFVVRNGKIDKRNIKYILQNKTYCGFQRFHDSWIKCNHEPIINEEMFEQAQAILAEKKKRSDESGHRTESSTLLGGIIFCARCGARFGKHRTGSAKYGYHYYYCCHSRQKRIRSMVKDPNCANKMYKIEELDSIICDEIKKLAMDPEYIESIKDAEPEDHIATIATLQKQIDSLGNQISRLMDLYSLGTFSIEELDGKIKPLQEQRMKLKKQLNSLQETAKRMSNDQIMQYILSFAEALEHGDMADKRAIVDQLIDRIDIDGDDIIIHWNFA